MGLLGLCLTWCMEWSCKNKNYEEMETYNQYYENFIGWTHPHTSHLKCLEMFIQDMLYYV